MAVAEKIDQIFTYGDYLKWDTDERYELHDGIPVLMSPAPTPRHQRISLSIVKLLLEKMPKDSGCKIFYAPFDVRLPESNEADEKITTVVQPDILITCDKEKLDNRGLRGAPDVVFEILSPATAARDMGSKRDLYEKHGVREYWIFDPSSKTALVYILRNAIYGKADVYSPGDEPAMQLFPEIVLPLNEIFPEEDLS